MQIEWCYESLTDQDIQIWYLIELFKYDLTQNLKGSYSLFLFCYFCHSKRQAYALGRSK
jgi:hypothetical protein